MRKINYLIAAALAGATAVSAVPFTASADEYVYGTMDIPYQDFYAAELTGTNNCVVDAVSSATTGKWSMNGEGQLFEGTYHSEANEDGTGLILGVTYPVAITKAELDSLGTNNYGFSKLDTQPEAYKTVSVADGKVSFSAVNDEKPETITSDVSLSTSSRYGDYQIKVNVPEDMGAVYGIVVKTEDGKTYGMAHEMNIWRGGEFSWSNGFVTTEAHGNTLAYERYDGLMGSTINEITYIGKKGYYTVASDTYVPVKFDGSLTVENSNSGKGSASFTATGFPEDYVIEYKPAEGMKVSEQTVSYENALPGNYTLTASDKSGKYADVSATFLLSTKDIPVTYSDGRLVSANGFTDADAENFIKGISSVTVNEKKYNTGKRGTTIIKEDGTIDLAASNKEGNVFDGSGNYNISVSSTGYENPFEFVISDKEAVLGDANGDGVLNVRDAAFIAKSLAQGKGGELPSEADFNKDGKVNVRDAAAIAKYLASAKTK